MHLRFKFSKLFLCFCLVLKIGIEPSFAQKDIILFENIDRENGLAQSTVNGILKGNDGFMWFATAEGLHRYDGYNFKIFKHNSRDEFSLSNNHITAIMEDSEGFMWLGTYTGELNRFDRKTQKFKRYLLADSSGEQNRYPVNCIAQNKEGSVLVGLDGGGMLLVNPISGSFVTYTQENSVLPNNYVNCFAPEANGLGLWVGTVSGLILYNQGKFKEFSSLSLFSNQFINGILHYKSMVYVVTNGQGLQVWDTKNDVVQPIESPRIRGANLTTFVLRDNVGNLWIGTNGGGLMKFDGDRYITYKNNPYNFRSIIGDELLTGYMDSEGILWFGAINGISKYDPNLRLFNLFQNFEIDDKPTNKNVYSIYETRDRKIWIGTLGSGLSEFNPKTEEITVHSVVKDQKSKVETKAVPAIYEDKSGMMWIGTRDEGLFSYDRETQTFTHHPPQSAQVKPNTIRHIMEDSEGKMWLATRWGLVQYIKETGEFKVFTTTYLNNNPIYRIIENQSRNELILVTFRAGVQIFHKDKQSFTVMQHGKDSTSPNVNAMMCIERIGNDSFMIGTYGGGINIFDRKNLSFTAINSEKGLPNDVVYGILTEKKGIYWLSTNDGLIRYDFRNQEFKQYNMNHYLQGLEFNEGAYWKTRDGTMYFGGTKGFNYFKPNNIKPSAGKPKVVLTSFKILDKEVDLPIDINYLDKLEIGYNEDLISFEFSSLSYSNSNENTYEYQLQGYDVNWINAGKRRVAYYGHLSPGVYTFMVRATTHDGVQSIDNKVIRIIVNPPYWQTWWFRILIGLLLLGLIGLIFYFRTKTLARSYKHKLVDLELKALRSQMNPHFIFNSLNSIQYFVLKNEPKEAYSYLTKFSSLMRMILQNSSAKNITVQAELDWLTTYLDLEKLRLENQLDYQIVVDDNIDKNNTLIPSMLIQPYVENAIIHGLLPKDKNRVLKITFSQKGQHITCLIEDNGIGREKSKELNSKRTKKHRSQGIQLTGERMEILTQDLKVKPELRIIDLFDENGESAGTRVQIEIPLIRKSKHEQD